MNKPNDSLHRYRVRIAANAHWSAACKTIRVVADSADNARAEALRHRAVAMWKDRCVVWTRRVKW